MFWLLLFGSTALIMLAVIEPKFAKRQERLERMSQSRIRAAQANAAGEAKPNDFGHTEAPRWKPSQRPTLRPLVLSIGAILLICSLAMRFTAGRRAAKGAQTGTSAPPSHGEAAS